VLQDVVAHLGGRSRGEGDDLRSAQRLQHLMQAHVVGAEVVAPLAEAMRFIHGEEADLHAAQRIDEGRAAEALGRDIDELAPHRAQPVEPLHLLVHADAAVDQRGGNAASGQCIDLIFHQRDERTDHDGHTIHHHRRQLVAKGFAPARGHDHQ